MNTPRFSSTFRSRARLVSALLAAMAAAQLDAATVFKENNGDALNAASSWVGGVLPTTSDTITWDDRLSAPIDGFFSQSVGAALSVGGIKISNPPAPVQLNGDARITIGSAGIDLTSATQPLAILDVATLANSTQTWATGGQALLLTGAVTRGANSFVRMDTSGGGSIQFPSTTTVNTVLSYATLNGADFPAVDSSFNVVPGSTISGLYTPNPNSAAANPDIVGSYGVMDVVNSNTGGINAFRVSSSTGLTVAGVRFGTAHATGLNWVADIPSGRNFNVGNRTILVTPAVGAHDVLINGSGNIRVGTGTQLTLLQDNLSGNLVLNAPITQPSGAGASLLKAGPGKVILASNNNGYGGGTIIHEGTLQIGNGGASGVLGSGNVTNNGALVFNRTDSVTVVHNILGTGSLTHAGTGETIFTTNASTFSGPINLNAGTLTFGLIGNLGTGTAINFDGGGLKWGTGNTTDVSARTLTFNAGGATINTNGNDVVLANSIGNGGAGGLTKAGTGTLTLQGANAYSGATAVTGGRLLAVNSTGSATGSGNLSLSSGATLAGTGTINGVVSTVASAILQPGNSGVGTLTLGGLSLASGSIIDVEASSTASHDKVVTTQADSLTINGGGVRLYAPGTTTDFAAAGAYNLFQYVGSVQGAGPTALSVLNPKAGFSYGFGSSGGFVTLTIIQDAIISDWNGSGGGSWSSSANWTNNVPSSDYTAQFLATLGAPATVTLDGSRTVNGLVFAGTSGYTLAQGTGGSLTFAKSSGSVAVNVDAGSHVISAPVVLSSSIGVTALAGASLEISGVVSGSGGIVKDGPGLLSLSGHNTFTGNVNVVNGVLGFSHADSLGSGSLTLDAATLRFNTGNTADISAKAINFGAHGGSIDTNGNDVVFANALGNASIGAFTKTGLGSLTLMADSTYQGDTYLTGGELIIAGNGSLGPETTTLHLNGGTLVPLSTMSLAGGTTERAVTVASASSGILVPQDTTFTIGGLMSGSGVLTKSGAGDLVITANNSARTGATVVEDGTIRLGNIIANGQNGLGTGPITLTGDVQFYLNGVGVQDTGNSTDFGGLANTVIVPEGASVAIRSPMRGRFTGALSGVAETIDNVTTYKSGNVDLYVDGTRFDVSANLTNFTGKLTVRKTPTGAGTDTDQFRLNAGLNMPSGKLHIVSGVTMAQVFNPPNSGTFTTTHSFGELTAEEGAILEGNPVGGRYNNYSVGALNTNFTIDGQFRGSLYSFGYGYPSLTKVGTGTLTLNNAHMMASPIAVNAGTLKVLGSIERFYTGIGADGVYGRDPVSLVCDDTISLTPPTTDYQNTEPGALTVAADGTLAGNGSLGGAITVNGRLQPDSTGLIGGKLTLTGAASLNLASTAVTQFDFSGASFTGVKSTSTGTVTYGGALKFNFLGTVFNGTYQVFELATAPAGAFTGATVTTTADAETALTDVGAGVWEGTVGLQTYSFNSATGVLTVTGSPSGSPVTPAAATLTANPGSGVVGLTWSAASGADTYLVKRSTTTGTGYVTLAAAATGTSYNDTTVTNGVTYYYVVQGRNTASSLLGANSNEATATPAAAPSHTDLQNWRFDQFGVYDDDGTVLAGDNEDFDGDGLVNLMEYALGTNPKVANASPITVAKVGNVLTLTYPRRSPADPALAYSVLGSNDLVSGFTAGAGTTNTVGSTSTYTDTADLSAAGSRRFLRLSVTYTAP